MAEQITIEGDNLTVTQPNQPRPKHRPIIEPTNGDTRSPSGWTLEDMIDKPNPFWTKDGEPIT